MSRWPSAVLAAALLAAASPVAAQCEPEHRGFPGLRQGQIHNPGSCRYNPLLPNTYRAARYEGFCPPRFASRCGRCGGSWGCGCFGGVAFVPIGWPWTYTSSFLGWATPWSSGFWFSAPAVNVIFVADASQAFGPAAANRFAGGALAATAPPRRASLPAETRRQRAASIAQSAARDNAARLLAAGDAFFREQKFDAALLRYRKAGAAAPRDAAPLARRAMVHVAQRRYDLAAQALRKALDIEPGLADSEFRLHELYGAQTAMQRRHCQELLAAAAAQPADGDRALVAGALLFLSHRKVDAQPLLARAEADAGNAPYVAGFLHRSTPRIGREAPQLVAAPPQQAADAPRDAGAPLATTLSQRLDP